MRLFTKNSERTKNIRFHRCMIDWCCNLEVLLFYDRSDVVSVDEKCSTIMRLWYFGQIVISEIEKWPMRIVHHADKFGFVSARARYTRCFEADKFSCEIAFLMHLLEARSFALQLTYWAIGYFADKMLADNRNAKIQSSGSLLLCFWSVSYYISVVQFSSVGMRIEAILCVAYFVSHSYVLCSDEKNLVTLAHIARG